MVRNVTAPDTEPEESNFPIPSEDKEHLFQVVDYKENNDGTISAKLEVVGGDEEGRSILHRVNPDDTAKSFYYCRMFLKAIGQPYKGAIAIDETKWVGRQFYATVKHSGKYANIDSYNFDKMVEQPVATGSSEIKPEDIQWDS